VSIFIGVLGLALLLAILWEGFETVILPRRVTRHFRFARMFYRCTWMVWRAVGRRMKPGKRRESYLSVYGPASLLFLFMNWALGLILSFAMLHWASGSGFHLPENAVTFFSDLYMSGTTFFTLGLGDITPYTPIARLITVAEAGIGFGFLAMVIGYLPVIYQGFSKREANISLLDARAGSPPTAAELLRRHGHPRGMESLATLLREWEVWSAELLESHISYPVLAFFRSQHNNESWLSALTAMLDVCTLLIAAIDGEDTPNWQARLTFAMARHALVDLAQIFSTPPRQPERDRLTASELAKLREFVAPANFQWLQGGEATRRIAELRQMYEPYANALARHFLLAVPPWLRSTSTLDNWQTSAWGKKSAHTTLSILDPPDEEHF
jgi:hypothetical protein